jgi:hypothetical protein
MSGWRVKMTPHELIIQLATYQGPCMRFCAYCPEDHNTKEVKQCVEKMYEEIYKLQQDKDVLMEDLVKIRKAYKEATGSDYRDDR